MSLVFSNKEKSHLESKLFFDGGVGVSRYDRVKYPVFDGFTTRQLGFFWRPEEIEVYRDSKDFKSLSPMEQHIFTSNLLRQIVLDSVQGRGPVAAFGPIVSLPELETWLTTWQFSETIHSRSYTHIIQNIYPDAGKVFDQILDIEELVTCKDDITKYYDDLINMNIAAARPSLDTGWTVFDEYEHKKALWKCLMAVNALEGIRFYVSFACSWAFAETKRMEGNAKIIKLICRDENLHLGSTQQMIKILPKDDPDFARIREETKDECIDIVRSAAEQEITWAKYLFKNGAMIGLNEQLLTSYIQWKTNRVLQAIGFEPIYDVPKTNPLPWTEKWIAGSDVQDAPQEVQLDRYVVGGVKQDVTTDFLSSLKL